MNVTLSSRRLRVTAIVAGVAALGALLVAIPQMAVAGPSVVTQTFPYTGSTGSFTVPSGITALTVTITGAEGGNGGADATPAPVPGGYRGVVSGTLAVAPGQVLTVAVGGGGATGVSNKNSGNASAAAAGTNPLGAYNGGTGGKAGANGSSGFGGAGGAASVLQVSGSNVVAAGGGGNGGSGQYGSTRGHTADAVYVPRADTSSTNGQTGLNANDVCAAASCSNNDGGGGGAGGGGAQGGAQGALEFGAGSSNEWFGYAGSIGQNSTASLTGLTSSYQYYSDNSASGSIVISYTTGSPAAPTSVSGTAGNGSVNLIWTAPSDPGQSAISDYLVQYSSDGGSTWSSPVDMSSTATSGTVTGLTNGTAYIFQVAAVNSVGTGISSASSSPVTPLGPPSAPTITLVTALDGALRLALTAPASGAPVTGYDYRINGGSWVTVPSTSTSIVIPGLINGTSYTVEVRGESTVGAGATSSPASGTPQAVPGAPTISSLSVGNGSLSVAFTPGFSGGGTITAYQYQLDGGSWVTASGTSSPIAITGLTAGTAYAVALRAVNVVGAGAASAPASATTPAAPGAPSVSSVLGGDGNATATFAPGSTGGSPITGYQYQLSAGGAWLDAPVTASPLVIGGLSNGTSYPISIRAVNAVGAGAASAAVPVTPATTPGAPSIIGNTVAGSDATLSAAFTAPASDGGSAVTGYQYSTDAGATWRDRTDGGAASGPVVITTLSTDGTTPLSNGVTYFVELRAVNAIGVGTASAVASGIATSVPSAPSIGSVAASANSLAVTFTAGSNGGSAITGYEYSVDGGTWTNTGTLGTTFLITGLSNGQSYAVRVRAVNSVGNGAASTAGHGTPVTLPGQPVITGVVRSNQTLTTAVALADNGGSSVTAWQYSTDGGATWATASGTTSPLALTALSSNTAVRLANGTGYAVQLRAVTAVGTGPASATTIVAPAAAPTAPSIALTAGDASVSVAFTLGTDGGSPLTQLEYSLDGGTSWISTGTMSSPFTISGLSNGTSYSVLLRADNAIGTGAASVPASTTPRTVPGAPLSVVAVSNSASADVSWTAPTSNGGSAITGYSVAAYATSTSTTAISTCTTAGTAACSLTGLTNGTAYYVAVTASNAAGSGPGSAPRVLVTPLARPAAPTLNSLTMGDSTISATFTAGSAGDRAITGYQYSVDGGVSWQAASGTTSPILITGLTDGTTYTVAVRAVSSAGVGAASNTLQGTPYTYPSAPDPTTIVANGGDAQLTVSWAAANLNGGVLANYTATAFTGLNSGTTAGYCTTTTLSCVITGTTTPLVNGTTYYVSLQTQNSAAMFSVRSAPRVPATPSKQPGAASGVTAVAGDASATVNWTAPTSTGASAITGYTVFCAANGGSYALCATASTPVTSMVVPSLTNGSSYTFEVYAINGNGTGPVSAASAAVTPLGAGTVPTFSAPVPTATGFTSAISNYDAATTYTATASNGATVTLSGSAVTVVGLSNGAASHLVVTAVKAGRITVSGMLDGAALLTGIAPTFSGNIATATGFTFTITNYDAAATYTLVAPGATVSRTGSAVTVTGLSLGGSASVGVTVAKAGSTTRSASDSGAAMVAGTAPTFSNLVATGTGFQVDIANYDPTLSYSLGVTGSASVSRIGSTVTVTGLSNGASADVTVTALNPGVSVASSVQTGSALLDGTAPMVSPVVQTTVGFGATITNPDAGASYTVTTTAGTVSLVGTTLTVTGLTPGQSANVTITVTKSGHVTTQTVVTAAALLAGITPLFGAPTRTVDGYTFVISNFDASGSYLLSTTAGTANLSGSTVTVVGLLPTAAATVTVTVSHAGYTDAAATQSGTALATGTAPVLGNVVATADGFTFAITNYDASLSYTSSLSPNGLVVIASDGTGTVSGEASGQLVALTVMATNPGVSTASASTSATVLVSGTAPVLSAGTPLARGYRFTITNFDPALTYSFVQLAGGTVVRSGDTVTVSGLGAAVTSDTTVVVAQAGHLGASATASGTSFPNGTAPAVSAVTRTLDGFTFELTLAPGSSYTVAADAGTATLSGTTVTVSGLAAGASTTVHITASAVGVLDEVTDVAGTAINPGVAPSFSTPVAATGGFVVTITNYSSAFAYTLATSAGTITRNGSQITVAGLGSGASATVSVIATRNGYRSARNSVAGQAVALAPVAPAARTVPTPTAPTVTTTPVVTEQLAPNSPSAASPIIPLKESTAGTGSITSAGGAVTSHVATTRRQVTVASATGLTLTVAAQRDGAALPLAADGVVEVPVAGQLRVTVAGLAADTLVTMWSMSNTTMLASAHTDGSGHTGNTLALPKDIKPGVHTLVVSGVNASGKPVTMQVGIRVLDVTKVAAVTHTAVTGSWWPWMIAMLIALLLTIWFLLARRRRRDREEAEQA
jgi:predicted RNA-binding protein with TRAM domain